MEMREEGWGYGWFAVVVFVGHVFELFHFLVCFVVVGFSVSRVVLNVRDPSRALYLQLTHISGLAFVRNDYHRSACIHSLSRKRRSCGETRLQLA